MISILGTQNKTKPPKLKTSNSEQRFAHIRFSHEVKSNEKKGTASFLLFITIITVVTIRHLLEQKHFKRRAL